MKLTILFLNLAWLIAVIGAFAIGRTFESSESTEESAAASPTNASSYRTNSGGRAPGKRGTEQQGSRFGSPSNGRTGVSLDGYLRETDALVKNKMFADLLLEMDTQKAEEIFLALSKNGRNGRENWQQMSLFLEAWGKLDGPAAIAAIGEMDGDSRRRGFSGGTVVRGWASVDPEGAKAYVAGIESERERRELTDGLVRGMATADPAGATQYVLQAAAKSEAERANSENGGRDDDRWRRFSYDRQLEAIASVQLQKGTAEATSWAEALPDGDIKSSAFDRVAESIARDDPEAAAAWILGHADKEYANRGVREVAEELARKDPAAAVAWAEKLPEASQASTLSQTVERWTREDPTAAGEYLAGMSPSAGRDVAISSFAREYDREDPQTAVQWVGSIANEELRMETLESVARSWARSNQEEAQNWLPNSGLSAEAQQRVLQEASRGGDRRGPRDRGRGGR